MSKEQTKFTKNMLLPMALACNIEDGEYELYAELCRRRHEKRVSYETWVLLRHAALHEYTIRGISKVKEEVA